MTVEQLIYNIEPKLQADFIALDEQIWTPYLSSFQFFDRKEIWTQEEDPSYLSIVINWQSLAQWKSIPTPKLMQLADEFDRLCLEKCGQKFQIKKSVTYNVL